VEPVDIGIKEIREIWKYKQLLIIGVGIVILLILRDRISDILSRLIFLYLFVALAFEIDARIPIGGALLLLVVAAVSIGRSEDFANRAAIYAYYFLVIGVLLQLVEYVREGKEEIRIGKPIEKPETTRTDRSRFIAIASGKGGVGKTTIAANLGVALSRFGKKVLLMDMDIAMPNLEIITGLRNPPVGLVDVLEGRLEIERVLYTGPEGTRVIPPGLILNGYTEKNIGKIRDVIKRVKAYDYEYTILDMPPGREAVEILDRGMEALLVVNPDKASILDALNMKLLLEKKGARVLGAVLNRSEGDENFWIEEIEKVLETSVVAVIPESRIVKEAFEREECFVEVEPESGPSREIMRLAEGLTGG
jgi:septum site-determining protein MinD